MRAPALIFACLLFSIISLQAQNQKTYVLDLKILPSEFGNKLGIHTPAFLKTEFSDWQQVNTNGTYTIELNFLSELDPKQYTRKRESGPIYFYKVKYTSPTYQAVIKNNSGETLFKKTYGGEEIASEYGKAEEQSDPDDLAIEWRKNRDAFYQNKEADFNNIDAFFPELVVLFGGGESMLSMEEKALEESPENVPETIESTILERVEEDTVAPSEMKEEAEEKVVAAISTPEPVAEPEPVMESEPIMEEAVEMVDARIEEPMVEESVEEAEPEIVETPEEKARRVREVNRQWEEDEAAAIKKKKEKDGRPRHFRIGLRLLVPNIAGVHGEIVTPLADNRLSLVGDFSSISFGDQVERFLDEGESFGDEIDGRYQYYSYGANFYFRKQYARGWYIGSSYMKGEAKTTGKVEGIASTAKVSYEAVAARLGLNTGRKAFMFGFEIGAGIPLKNLEGQILIVDDNIVEVEKVDEKIPVIPVLNVTFGVAF